MIKRNAIVGIFNTHLDAIDAIKVLKKHHFPLKHIALVSQDEAVKEIKSVLTWEDVSKKGSITGAILGGGLGMIFGMGLVDIPIFGILYEKGWLSTLVTTIEGVVLGGVLGFIIGILLGFEVGPEGIVSGKDDPEDLKKYAKELNDGKFLLIVHGPKEEVTQAHTILEEQGHLVHKEFGSGFHIG